MHLHRPVTYMGKVLAFLILSPFFLYYLFQPQVERTLDYRDQVLQKKAYEMAHLAAINGALTESIKQKITSDLASVYFDPSHLTLTGPSVRVPRGEWIEVSLRYPRGTTQIFNLFGADEARDNYYKIPIMSEYLEGQV